MTKRVDSDAYAALVAGGTLSGKDICRRATDPQNHFRARMSELSSAVVTSLHRHGLAGQLLLDTVARLRVARDDHRHYGDNQPDSYFDDPRGTTVVPNPRFSYWNLYEYGITGEDGFKGFIRDAEIDPTIDWPTLCGLIALLLIDSAVEFLDADQPYLAASDSLEAAQAVEQMFQDRGYRQLLVAARRELARRGGRAAHRETNEYKALIVAKWRAGEFETKVAAARWAMKQFPLKSQEVVARWLREADKGHPSATELDQ